MDHNMLYSHKQKIKKISDWIINILRMGVYQIIFLDKIPLSAAVNESVKLAKRYGHQASSGFVNGVLRNVGRSGDDYAVFECDGVDSKCSYNVFSKDYLVKENAMTLPVYGIVHGEGQNGVLAIIEDGVEQA